LTVTADDKACFEALNSAVVSKLVFVDPLGRQGSVACGEYDYDSPSAVGFVGLVLIALCQLPVFGVVVAPSLLKSSRFR
jgi:hypothetical protein